MKVLTIKELKKKHSSRPVGGVEMGSQGREDVEDQADKMVTGEHSSSTFTCR